MQGTNWLFTINNPTWEDDPLKWPGVKFIAFQKERGDETGTEHFQGYVQFKVNKRLAACKALHLTAHWELRKGTHEQAKAYCTKEDTRIEGPWIEGVEPAPAKRNDLSLCMADVKAGMTEVELAEKYEGTWAFLRDLFICETDASVKNNIIGGSRIQRGVNKKEIVGADGSDVRSSRKITEHNGDVHSLESIKFMS